MDGCPVSFVLFALFVASDVRLLMPRITPRLPRTYLFFTVFESYVCSYCYAGTNLPSVDGSCHIGNTCVNDLFLSPFVFCYRFCFVFFLIS